VQLPSLKALLTRKTRGGLNIVELGAGCGIVGISLAQMIPKCNVLLTDLDDAQEMLQRNIKCAQLAAASTVRQAVLDWAVPLDESVLPQRIDLVLIADCIYNTDSIPSLVKTLKQIHVHSPDCRSFVARKPRHDSEMLFFKLIEEAGIRPIETCTRRLPHLDAEVDAIPPPVGFYLYGPR